MADLTNVNSVSISKILSNLETFKYNPSGIQRTILECLDEVTNGQVDIVDATNPFVFLLEASSVNTALAINENFSNSRKQYPSLAQTSEELYPHMSDIDFINRFSTPSETNFTMLIQVNDINNKLVWDSNENCYKGIIARDTEFSVDGYIFTLQYPIVIRKYNNGLVQLSYDPTITSPLQTLTSNIIDYVVRKDSTLVDWIFFKIPVKQLQLNFTYYPLQQSILFNQSIPFQDKYYYCRIFYKNDLTNNLFKEINTTYTDQVFDPLNPTAIIKVFDSYVNVFIPPVYLTSGLVSGSIRIDIYTTKGSVNINMANYLTSSFITNLRAVDEDRDINVYTNAMVDVNYYSYCDERIIGGSGELSFEELRNRVILNSIGNSNLPITNAQLEVTANNKGFELIKDVDTITNRIFLATRKLPKPLNVKLNTPINIGIATYIGSIDYLKSIDSVVDNGTRVTLLSNNLFKNNNGIVTVITPLEVQNIKTLPTASLLDNVNSNQYLYNPFYYIFDSSENTFDIRVYNLDYPIANSLSFKTQNDTLQLPVNTGTYSLVKSNTGYKLTVVTKSGNFYKQLSDNQVNIQLAYYPIGSTKLAYIEGSLIAKQSDDERIYEFTIDTNYDIDLDNNIGILNGKQIDNSNIITWINLASKFYILYTTTSLVTDFIPDSSNSLLGQFLLPPNSAVVTLEELDVVLGNSLDNLWVKSRNIATGLQYEKYQLDVPMYYEKTEYQIDPVTNTIFSFDSNGHLQYNVIHNQGDPVLDNDGHQVYLHKAGDTVLDNNGNPVIISPLSVNKEIDFLLLDGRYFFTTDVIFTSYRDEVISTINSWVTNDISNIQKILLEKSKIYFYPNTTFNTVKVSQDILTEDIINPEQSIIVDLYVTDVLYNDDVLRTSITDSIIKILDLHFELDTINITDITNEIKTNVGGNLISAKVSGLGGIKNYSLLYIESKNNKLYLKKKLALQQDSKLIIQEDVVVNFFNITKKI